MSEEVNRGSLKAQGIDRPATRHLGSKASAMNRNGCLLRKAEINQLVSFDSRRLAEINNQLNQLKTMRIESPANSPLNLKSVQQRCPIWRERTTRVDQVQTPDLTGWLCMENRPLPITEIDVLQILPRRPAHQDPARELAYLLAR
jgi:hypothetical protein